MFGLDKLRGGDVVGYLLWCSSSGVGQFGVEKVFVDRSQCAASQQFDGVASNCFGLSPLSHLLWQALRLATSRKSIKLETH